MADEIIKDVAILKDISQISNCDTQEEGKIIAQEMFIALSKQKTAPAISANQIGIQKRVIALNVREAVYLINPVITACSMPTPHVESHASFPQKLFTTIRYASVTVKADNIEKEFTFGLKENQKHLLYQGNRVNVALTTHPLVMEAAYVQQAIDTLNGVMPIERTLQHIDPVKKSNTPNRNEVVILCKGKETIKIKYKKALKLIEEGWVIKTKE